MKKDQVKELIICTFVPLVLPFILEIPSEVMSCLARTLLFLFFLVADLVFIWIFYKKRAKNQSASKISKVTRAAYSNAYQLSERKRNYLINKSYDDKFAMPKEFIAYDVHDYISEICNNFRDTVSAITKISKEHMSVTFVYRYIFDDANNDELSWRWVVGKDTAMRMPLNKLVNKQGTLYNWMVNGNKGDGENFVFANDKKDLEKQARYYMSTRDKNHNCQGSVFASKVYFGNNATSFVESIILVSSYGVQFARQDSEFDAVELKNLLFDELFPYYQRLLETELGVLYLRHRGNSQYKSNPIHF